MRNELETGARYLSPGEQYQLRRSIIRLNKQGKKNQEVSAILDVSIRLVQTTKKAYKLEGLEGIKPKKRGRRKGEKRLLTPEQEKEIQKTIVEMNPEQLKMKCCLWTKRAIHDLILQKYKLDMGSSTLGYYLARWGYSIQRPIKKARNQNPEQVDQWMNEEYPSIAAIAKAERAEIYWGDETALQNTANYARGYSPKGHAPVLEVESKRMKLNLLSAISNRGKLRFTISKESVNAVILIDS